MKGKAVQIVKPVEGHEFELDKNGLLELLTRPEVKNREVCVVSVAGAFRKGKSFLLDFFLRYLYKNYVAQKFCDNDSWLGDEDEKLEGFSWRSGAERDTVGILMWSDVFLYDHPDGGKIAILLLDTQGAFDSKSTLHNCTTIFALSTMLSSVQIYNLSGNLQEDDLQHLQLFSEYGRLALESIDNKSFQNLQFLIRDWAFPSDAEFGAEGGRRVLRNFLATTDDMHSELRSLRKHIFSCFTNIDCFLMPHPGHCVEDAKFYGALNELRDVFKQQLKEFVPSILSAKNLVIRKINGKNVTATDIVFYFEKYTKLFGSNELPKPINILTATAEANYQAAISSLIDRYNENMRQLTHKDEPFLEPSDFQRLHDELRDEIIEEFLTQPKMVSEELLLTYQKKLESDITNAFDGYYSINNGKLALAEAAQLRDMSSIIDHYEQKMRELTHKDAPYIKPEVFEIVHCTLRDKLIEKFSAKPNMASEEMNSTYLEKLETAIEKSFEGFKELNNFKLATTEANLQAVFSNLIEKYHKAMRNLTRKDEPFIQQTTFQQKHSFLMEKLVHEFTTQPELQDNSSYLQYLEQLKSEIAESFQGYDDINNSKLIKRLCPLIETTVDENDSRQPEYSRLCETPSDNCSNKSLSVNSTSNNIEVAENKQQNFPHGAAEGNIQSLVRQFLDEYNARMRELTQKDHPFVQTHDFHHVHNTLKSELLEKLKAKVDNMELYRSYSTKLERSIEENLDCYKDINDSKLNNIESKLKVFVATLIRDYHQKMSEVTLEFVEPSHLKSEHYRFRDQLTEEFTRQPETGSKHLFEVHLLELQIAIDNELSKYLNANEDKVAIAETKHINDLYECVNLFERSVRAYCGGSTPYMTSEELKRNLLSSLDEALTKFDEQIPYANDVTHKKVREKLEIHIKQLFSEYENENNNKLALLRTEIGKAFARARQLFDLKVKSSIQSENFEDMYDEAKREALSELDDQNTENLREEFEERRNQFIEELEEYFEIFKGLHDNHQNKLKLSLTEGHDFYMGTMGYILNNTYMKPEELEENHETFKATVSDNFRRQYEANWTSNCSNTLDYLQKMCNDTFKLYKENNNSILVRAEDHYRKLKRQLKKQMSEIDCKVAVQGFEAKIKEAKASAMRKFDNDRGLYGNVPVFDELRSELNRALDAISDEKIHLNLKHNNACTIL